MYNMNNIYNIYNMMSFQKFKDIGNLISYIQKNLHTILLVSSIVIIAILAIYNIFFIEEGTWADNYEYRPKLSKELIDTLYNSDNQTHKSYKKQGSKGERECRRVLESLFGESFPNTRPMYMQNEITKEKLELDCYNEKIGLALEYNGKQHYEYNSFFHSSYAEFKEQQYRDFMKKSLCDRYGIKLIVVPYTIKLEDIEEYIINDLRKFGYNI